MNELKMKKNSVFTIDISLIKKTLQATEKFIREKPLILATKQQILPTEDCKLLRKTLENDKAYNYDQYSTLISLFNS